ncbi:MAG: cobyrinic acid a,c-diamide synthase [Coleofasciculus sp. G1-WW12-02]|uniref:cobyrinic acid a,c-diamide synthase n=1 Tax=unclassified Coleofasciculus TaxID=2692782 RepID=UPI003304B044
MLTKNSHSLEATQGIGVLAKITLAVKKWANTLPSDQRKHIMSLCYLMCATSPEIQAELTDFLDDYVADSLVEQILQDRIRLQLVTKYLREFCIEKELTPLVLNSYVEQFCIHSAQTLQKKPELYLEFVLRLIHSAEERHDLFNYILGCEVIKMMFQMSWLQHERLYQLQKNQESFIRTYIKPIQHAHRINGIVVPKNENLFFAKRDYYIKQPNIPEKKLVELVVSTFAHKIVINLGFSISCNLDFLAFDHEYIYSNEEPDCIFYATV